MSLIHLPLFPFACTGGQLRTKNGQKYTINSRNPGVFVPRYCIVLTALLGVVAMIAIALLSYFLLSPLR